MTAKGPPALVVLLLATASAACGRIFTPRAVPIEPIQGILDAFRSHPIVALGEGMHGNEQSHAFRLALIRDPRFPAVVNDIVVEFGSARYQDVMDRFVEGDDVPEWQLVHAWRDVAQNGSLTDLPIYEEFFRAVRAVNAALPRERHLRVLLGDPPIHWEDIASREDLQPWIELRDSHAAALINKEVLARNRRALVIYGDAHFVRHREWGGVATPTLAGLLADVGPTTVFSIWTNTTVQLERMQSTVASWPIPSLALVRGTKLGTVSFAAYSGLQSGRLMEDQYDAVLYLGPVSTITSAQMSPALCRDAAYMKMRLSRLALSPPSPMGSDVERFRNECAERLRQDKQ